MAYDHVIDGAQLDADITRVADIIRAKGGTGAKLTWPQGFVDAVTAMQAGGGGSADIAPFSRIEIKKWTPKEDTLYYHVDDTAGLAAVALFCAGSKVGSSGIHSIFCVTDPVYKQEQYGNPVGCWSGRSFGPASGLASYNYPSPGSIGDDNSSTYFATNREYIVILMYGPM